MCNSKTAGSHDSYLQSISDCLLFFILLDYNHFKTLMIHFRCMFQHLWISNVHTHTYTPPLLGLPHLSLSLSPPLCLTDTSTHPHIRAAEQTHMYMPSVLNQPKRQLFKRTILWLRKQPNTAAPRSHQGQTSM